MRTFSLYICNIYLVNNNERMKIFILRLCVMWWRFRQGERYQNKHHVQYTTEMEALMWRANPFVSWQERANWIIDITEWIRYKPMVSLLKEGTWRRVK